MAKPSKFNVEEVFPEEPSENPDLGKADGRGTDDGEPVTFRLYVTSLVAPGHAETLEYTLDFDQVARVCGAFDEGAPSLLFTTVEGDIIGIPRSNLFDFSIETIRATNVIPFRRK